MLLLLTRAERTQSLMFLSARVAGGEARRGGSWGAAQELIYLGPHGFAVAKVAPSLGSVRGPSPTSPPPRYAWGPLPLLPLTRAERTQ